MPDRFPTVSDDIAFELLILHAIAEKGQALKGARASALRSSLLWEAPFRLRRPAAGKKVLMHVASALVIASTLSVTPATTLPAWAQRQEIRLTVVDVHSGKPLSDVVLRDVKGNALGRTHADGKITFSAPADAQRFTLERAGYQSVTLIRSQLGGSNLVSMRKTTAQVAPTIAPTAKPTARPAVQATPKPVQKPKAIPAPRRTPQVRRPVTPKAGRYVVKRGDTLWDIAAMTLGNPLLWPNLYQANRATIRRPNLIYPGQTIVIPSKTTVAPRFRGTYTVSRGDNLWDIASEVYGNPLRWKAIYQANRVIIKRPSLIYPGQTLLLPR